MNTNNWVAGAIAAAWMLLAIGCGGSSSGGDDNPAAPPPAPEAPANFSVGGAVTGLQGTLVVAINGGDALTLSANGAFAFAASLAPGSSYSVAVRTQPAHQTCTVSNGDGTIAAAAVTNVEVHCAAITRTVGGNVYGLAPSRTLVLQNNGGETLTLGADGVFAFSNTLPFGGAYSVAVQTQPAGQTCTVSHGSGTIAEAAVTDITVNCSTITAAIGGTVAGLDPFESLVLQNNGSDNLAVNGNGGFSFSTPVAQAAGYDVTVLTQPATQTCTVTNGSGTAGAAAVTNVQVTCSTNAYTVGGTVSGLSGTVTLQNNGADSQVINSNGAFTFSTPVAQGAAYNVTVLTQPAAQTCTVTNGSGTLGGANVTNVNLNCVNNTTTLSISVSALALSVTGLTEYGVSGTPSSGVDRTITITNTGSDAALNLLVTAPTWPSGTSSSTNCGSVLAASQTCTITITPGSSASSDGTNPCSIGTAPLPGTVEVAGDNTNTVSSAVVVLSYGCVYQGGYVYALDDTVAPVQSVGGKVVATTDQALPAPSGVIWSSDGNSGVTALDTIYGISETSTISSPDPNSGGPLSGQSACDGASDGACNTANIVAYYGNFSPNAPVATSYYAAGLCTQTISSYSDWSLPAICELGYGTSACGIAGAPTTQNMQSSLVDYNGLELLADQYWSSTEFSSAAQTMAWAHIFAAGGGAQNIQLKSTMAGVRCSRALSN